MQAVVLTAGEGLRMWPFTQVMPKCLLPVPSGKPCVREIIEELEAFSIFLIVNEVHLSLYKHEFRDTKMQIIPVEAKGNNMGSLLSVKEQLSSPFLLIYGDIYGFREFDELVKSYREPATIAVTRQYNIPYGVAHITGSRVHCFEEKPQVPDWWISQNLALWSGVAVFSKSVLDSCFHGGDIAKDLLTKLAANNQLGCYFASVPCQDVGEWENYKRLFEGMKPKRRSEDGGG